MKGQSEFQIPEHFIYLLGGPKGGEFFKMAPTPEWRVPMLGRKGPMEARYEKIGEGKLVFGRRLTITITVMHEFARKVQTEARVEREVDEALLYSKAFERTLGHLLGEVKKELLHLVAEIFTAIDDMDPHGGRIGYYLAGGSRPEMYRDALDPTP